MPDVRDRPSVPHHLRVPTDKHRPIQREPEHDPATEAETVREQFQTDPAIAELLALVREPSGVSIETLLKVLALSSRQAVVAARQDSKLGVDLGVGKIDERLDSMMGTLLGKRRRREIISLVGFISSAVATSIMAVWMAVAPQAREAAEVAVIAPAIEAKRVAEVAVDRADEHAARLDVFEKNQKMLMAAVERLNGAVVALTDRLPLPTPTRVDVTTDASKPKGQP